MAGTGVLVALGGVLVALGAWILWAELRRRCSSTAPDWVLLHFERDDPLSQELPVPDRARADAPDTKKTDPTLSAEPVDRRSNRCTRT